MKPDSAAATLGATLNRHPTEQDDIDHLRQQISVSEAVTRRLYTQLNSRNCFVSLPRELIGMIVELNRPGPHSGRKTALWTLANVCHELREVCIKYRGLWTDISCNSPEWAQEKLILSRGAPIVVKIRKGLSPSGKMALQNSLEQLAQIKELLIIHCPSEHVGLLQCPAKQLEKCHITFARGADTLSGQLFAGDAPQLRHLYLSNCGMDWLPGICANLVDLNVVQNHVTMYPLSMEKFINHLSTMLCLEQLTISTKFAHGNDQLPMVAHLPRLQNLAFESDLRGCVRFLECLAYGQQLSRTKFTCRSGPESDDIQLHYAPTFTRLLQERLSVGLIRCIKVLGTQTLTQRGRVLSFLALGGAGPPPGSPRLQVHAKGFTKAMNEYLMEHILRHFSGHLTKLGITSEAGHVSDSAWLAIGKFKLLQGLSIAPHTAMAFLRAFWCTDPVTRQAITTFKALESLSFTEHYTQNAAFGDTLIKNLKDSLKGRIMEACKCLRGWS
ncbi:hypothetical protein DXG01_013942 [Tephrocybe rancida]|nr:hypothetical protein DXG01_013942 [Tephrocybe rancida]